MRATAYAESVFINCPFDADYQPLFRALVFAVHDCGFVARSAREVMDGGEARITKIIRLIEQSKYGIHDLSRTELDRRSRLPRFNMPLELGLFLGAKEFGQKAQREKITLVFEKRKFSHQRYCSDIGGQDIEAHEGRQARAISSVRDWLSTHSAKQMPGGKDITRRFRQFHRQLPALCKSVKLDQKELTFVDYSYLLVEYLKAEQAAIIKLA